MQQCSKIKRYFFLNNGFILLNKISNEFFTREGSHHESSTCIDHIATNAFPNNRMQISYSDLDNILSDHRSILISISKLDTNARFNKIITISRLQHQKLLDSGALKNVKSDSTNQFINDIQKTIQDYTETFSFKDKLYNELDSKIKRFHNLNLIKTRIKELMYEAAEEEFENVSLN